MTEGNGNGKATLSIDAVVPEAAVIVGDTPPAPRGMRAVLRTALAWGDLRHTPYGLTPATIIGLIFFIGAFESAAFNVAAPTIAQDLNIKLSGIIATIVIVNFFAIFGAIFLGYAADRTRRVPYLAGGAVVEGVFAMLTGATGNGFALTGVRSMDELATAGTEVPTFGLLADYYPIETRGRMYSVVLSISRAGRLIAPLIAGFLVVHVGWRRSFVMFGAPLVALGFIALWRLREPVRGYFERKAVGLDEEQAAVEDEPQSMGEAWRTVWAIRTVRRVFISELFASAGDQVFGLYFLIALLPGLYHLDAFDRGKALTPAFAATLLGVYIGGGLVDSLLRLNPSRVLMLFGFATLLTAFGYALAAQHRALWIVITTYSIANFGGALIGPALRAIYAQVIPASVRTQGLQMTRLSEIPGFVLAVPFAGSLLAKHGYTTCLMFSVPLLVIGAFVFMTAGKFFAFDMRNALAVTKANEEFRRAKNEGRGKLLVCRDVDVAYDGVQVLFGVDFDVEQGDIVALLGTNGAGKSTLLRAISGSQEADAGAIVYDGRDITHMPPHEIARRHVVHMPGGRGVFPGLSVRENLLLGNWMTDDDSEVRRRLAEVFDIFPILRQRADESAAALSGGEQQMLSLAQAFLADPRLLMIDELSLGLSPAVVQQLVEIVREIHRRGVTIIVVEQSVNVALTIAEKAIFMEKGEVKFFGQTAELLQRPDILRAVYVKGTGALTDGGPRGATRTERERRALAVEAARPVLAVEHIVKRFGGIVAVDDISFELREGESLGIIGPNGSGKTTLFDIISGYQPADGGVVKFDDVDITDLGPDERARRHLVRRFQDARLFPSLTVFETLLVALEQRLEVRSTFLNALGVPQARRAERRLRLRADRLIELLELGAYRDKFVKELSTGVRRITDLACVLAAEPRVLLLDEPSSGIAQAEAEGLAPLLRRVRHETGCSLLIIEHDMPLISAVADELIALELGTILLRGTPDVVLNDDRVIESYLGTSEAVVKRSGLLV